MEFDDLFDFDGDLFDDAAIEEGEKGFDTVETQEKFDYNSLRFNCSEDFADEDIPNSIFLKDLKDVLNERAYKMPEDNSLFNYSFNEDLPVDVLIRIARTTIQKIASSIVDSTGQRASSSFFAMRQNVTQLLLTLRCDCQNLKYEDLQLLRVALGTFESMQGLSSIQPSLCAEGNSSKSSLYHLLHGQLEWRWIYLSIIYRRERANGILCSDQSDFKAEITLLMFDLISLSIAKYYKTNLATIISTSPFICSCVKVMWIVVYQLIAQLNDSSVNFWEIFSDLLNDIRGNKNPYESYRSKKVMARSLNRSSCRNFEQFSVWIIAGLATLLKNFSPDEPNNKQSYELFESSMKQNTNVDISEDNLRVLLVMISEVIFDVWPARSEVLLLLWEHFQRKINSPFYILGQNLNSVAVSSISGEGSLTKLKALVNSPKINPNSTSFDMFVQLLGKLMQRLTQDGQKNQVQRILGRIYTKFPRSKLVGLNEMGIHNVTKLLLALSITTNFDDVVKKISEIFLQIPIEKVNHQQQMMKGHIAFLILHRENQMNITAYASKLMAQVNQLTETSNSSINAVLKILADALPVFFLKLSDEDCFENGEEIFLDSWIIKYLSNGTVAEQDRVYETLTKISKKLQESSINSLGASHQLVIVKKLLTILLPFCKQIFGKSESVWLPFLSANLCLLANKYQQPQGSDIPKFDTTFRSFLDVNSSNNPENTVKFLSAIMERRNELKQLDIMLVMQMWIKSSVLLSGNNAHLKDLTKHINLLEDVKLFSDTARNQPEEFLNSKEPLCTFITDVGRKYQSVNNQFKLQMIDKMHGYFSQFEKWALPFLQIQQQQQSSQRTPSDMIVDECVMRIFTFISITILHCSELIYVRSKSSCFFNIAISQFILTPPLMMGQSVPRAVAVSMYKVWPLLIDGISKLDFKKDQHIGKVFNDLIVKWAPNLKISVNPKVVSKPFLNVVLKNNTEVVELVYGALGKHFVALQNRKTGPHAALILTVVEEVMHVVEGEEAKVVMVWRNLMQHVIEAAMMTEENNPIQSTSCNLIKRFIHNKNYETSQQMKELIGNGIKIAIQSHLSYNSANCFKFLSKTAKYHRETINMLLPSLMEQIKKCEQMRGSGFDTKLRSLYDQLLKNMNK